MNKSEKTLAITAVAGAVGVLAVKNMHRDLYHRFPELDRKVVRKAFWSMMKRAVRQQIDVAGLDDSQMDELFLKEVALVTAK